MTGLDSKSDTTRHTRSDTMSVGLQPREVNEHRQQINCDKLFQRSVATVSSVSPQKCYTEDLKVLNGKHSHFYTRSDDCSYTNKMSQTLTHASTHGSNTSVSQKAMAVKPLLQDIPEMYQRVSIQESSNCDTLSCLQQRTACQFTESTNKSQMSLFQARLNVPFTVLQMFYWTSLFLMTKAAFVQGKV